MPNWKNKIYLSDIWKNEDLAFEQRRDAIVQRIKESRWYEDRDTDGFDDLGMYVEDLAYSQDYDEFNDYWAAIYDEADRDHSCWIDLYSPVPGSAVV